MGRYPSCNFFNTATKNGGAPNPSGLNDAISAYVNSGNPLRCVSYDALLPL